MHLHVWSGRLLGGLLPQPHKVPNLTLSKLMTPQPGWTPNSTPLACSPTHKSAPGTCLHSSYRSHLQGTLTLGWCGLSRRNHRPRQTQWLKSASICLWAVMELSSWAHTCGHHLENLGRLALHTSNFSSQGLWRSPNFPTEILFRVRHFLQSP